MDLLCTNDYIVYNTLIKKKYDLKKCFNILDNIIYKNYSIKCVIENIFFYPLNIFIYIKNKIK